MRKNKPKLRVLVDCGFNGQYLDFLNKYYKVTPIIWKDITSFAEKKTIKPDLIIFTGGEDVSPEMYGEEEGKQTQKNSNRDKLEEKIFNAFFGIPKLGICRGSQLLTVLSGGKLIQHITGHGGNHKIHIDGNFSPDLVKKTSLNLLTYEITSTHHQMMFPFNMNHKEFDIIGWSKKFLSNTYLDGKNKENLLPDKFVEPEIVYYHRTRSLCVQGHPEFPNCPLETVELILKYIDNLLLRNTREKRWYETF